MAKINISYKSPEVRARFRSKERELQPDACCDICDNMTKIRIWDCGESWCDEPHVMCVCKSCRKLFGWVEFATSFQNHISIDTLRARRLYHDIRKRILKEEGLE